MKKEKDIKPKLSKLVSTFFRNALKSNLDLTSLADTKAGILISINGFILTVSVTATSFAVHNDIMTYAFVSIIVTSLGSIIFAVLAVKPRHKQKLVQKEHLDEYSSLLYYQDMADMSPKLYLQKMKKVLISTEESTDEMTMHLHILGAEIKKKYFWLKWAYTFFSLGLTISASLIIYGLLYVDKTPFYNLSKGNVAYKEDKFYNIFEPSGATTLPDGKVLIVEDERSENPIRMLDIKDDGNVVEIGNLYIDKKIKKFFKKRVEDLEAITSSGNIVYAVTSHSLNKSHKRKSSREKLISFVYDDGKMREFKIYDTLKDDLYKKYHDFFTNTIFGIEDISIEGLCFDEKDNSLLIGFRAPVVDGYAIVIGIKNPKEVMSGLQKPNFSKPFRLNLNGLGIRDMTYDVKKGGYWIIAGGSSDRNFNFQLWFWDKNKQKVSFVKNHPYIGYGEGITVVHQSSKKSALLIVEDDGIKPNKSADYIIIDRDSL
jgi:hypothetical protein